MGPMMRNSSDVNMRMTLEPINFENNNSRLYSGGVLNKNEREKLSKDNLINDKNEGVVEKTKSLTANNFNIKKVDVYKPDSKKLVTKAQLERRNKRAEEGKGSTTTLSSNNKISGNRISSSKLSNI